MTALASPTSAGPPTPRRSAGQATVELALLLPLVLTLVLVVVQVALATRQQILLVNAVRETARAALAASDVDQALALGRDHSGLDPNRLQLTLTGGEPGGLMTVSGRFDAVAVLPLPIVWHHSYTLRSELTVRREPPLGPVAG